MREMVCIHEQKYSKAMDERGCQGHCSRGAAKKSSSHALMFTISTILRRKDFVQKGGEKFLNTVKRMNIFKVISTII